MTWGLERIKETTCRLVNLHPQDELVIDFTVALLISNLCTTGFDSAWGYIIGPPGSGKSLMLEQLQDLPEYVQYLSSLTEKALASGWVDSDSGEDHSLIPKLNGKVLVIKDFTSILSIDEGTQKSILGDLREAFDGSYLKWFGHIGGREYRSKFGIIAGVTPMIDATVRVEQPALGERFVAFRLSSGCVTPYSDRMDKLSVILNSMSNKGSWREEMKAAWHQGIIEIRRALPNQHFVPPSPLFSKRVRAAADLVARLRTAPVKDKPQEPEVATRLTQQFAGLGSGHALASGLDDWNEDSGRLVARVAKDTLPRDVATLLRILYLWSNRGASISPRRIVQYTHLGLARTLQLLLQYEYTDIVERSTSGVKLTDPTLQQISDANLYPENPNGKTASTTAQ